ncbi:MAG: ATP-binding protein, partial [Nostocales cyanobacterium]
MKLTSIKLCNFRSFYGQTPEILIASGDFRNTTIIHGNNGAGKTSLLNAFTWVLYEKFTAAFAATEQLVNKRAISEVQENQAVECWVEVGWEHEGTRYRAKRTCRVYKNLTTQEATKTKLTIQYANEEGKWGFPIEPAEEIINNILPASLHQYFFFDGERIEEIVRSDKKTEIAEATETFLGVKVIDLAIRHLKEAKKSLDNDLAAIGDAETKKLLSEQNKLEQEIEKISQRQTEIKQELENQQTFKKDISTRLIELTAVKELQERRQNLETQKRTNQEELKKTKDTLKKIISKQAYTVLLGETNQQFREIISNLKQRGELTSGISKEFVSELIQTGRCICGADLKEGGHGHFHVKSLLRKTGSSSVEETAIRMGAQIDDIDKQANLFWENVDREQARINQLRESISELETELDKIQEILRKDPNEDISGLQKRLDEIEAKIDDLN